MLELSFALVIPLYAVLAAQASRHGTTRLWLATAACIAFVAGLASIAAAATAREHPIRAGLAIAAAYAIPIVTASLGAWARPGRTVSALAGGVLGLLAMFGGMLFLISRVHA